MKCVSLAMSTVGIHKILNESHMIIHVHVVLSSSKVFPCILA